MNEGIYVSAIMRDGKDILGNPTMICDIIGISETEMDAIKEIKKYVKRHNYNEKGYFPVVTAIDLPPFLVRI